MAKAKTKEEKLKEKIDNLLKSVKQSQETAISISKNHAVNIADNINREDAKSVKARNEQLVSYRSWLARAAVYKEIEENITNLLYGY